MLSLSQFIKGEYVKYLFVLFSCLVFLAGCGRQVEQVHLSGPTMGTTYNVKYLVAETSPDAAVLQQGIDKILVQVNDQMSTYRKDSELSRFNQTHDTEPFILSKETATVVKEALRLNKLTLGKLDVTVGPLVNLWGFGPEGRPDKVPSAKALADRRAEVGISHLTLDGVQLSKDIPNLYVDLSTIAKGWGVDQVADYLEQSGIDNYMVEIGGEIRLKGLNRDGVKWRIAIEKPVANERSVQEIISPGTMAMATSGDYRNYFEQDGIRYSHIIDPDTGKPINNRVVSVTVLHPSCMTADGLATGLMVLGDEQGMAIAKQHHLAVMMIVKTDTGFEEKVSEAFRPYLKKQ
nr:FAD:protein FMN transferase [Vibrio tritonius]